MMGIKKTVKLLLFMMIIAFLTGCQPTPHENVVDDKGNNALIEKIKTEQGNGKINVPDIWNEKMQTGNIYVNIDADILHPDVEKYPAYTTAPSTDFSMELTKRLADFLFEGEPIYQAQSLNTLNYTKAEINEIIVEKNKEADDFEKYVKNRGYTEVRDDSIRNSYQQQLKEYNDQYETAPDQITVSKESEWKYQDSGNEKLLYLTALSEDKTMRRGNMQISIAPGTINVFYQRDFRKVYEQGPEIKDEISTLSISSNEAQRKVDDLLTVINGVTGDDYRVFSQNIGYIRPYYQDPSTYNNIGDDPQCYMYTIYRYYNGIPAIYAQTSHGDTESVELYSVPWFPEQFIVSVDDSGIANIMWNGLGTIKETLSENVPMLSFEEIQDRFRQHMSFQWAYDSDPTIIKTDLNINRITLGMMRVIKKDNPDVYLMIPVWDFFGRLDEQYPKGMLPNHNDTISNELFSTSFLTINAIDGSIINRNIGY